MKLSRSIDETLFIQKQGLDEFEIQIMSKIEDVVKDNKKTFEGIAKGM